jgi:large subunit ribosomal protein L25
LRREGIIPALIYGKSLEESILIKISLGDVNRFLSMVSKGSRLIIEVDGDKYDVLFKEITYEAISQRVEHIEFQQLVADEAVNSVAKVVLKNKENNPNIIQQHIEEIPYNALPKDFVQEVIINLEGMEAGSTVKVADLDIVENENIRITIPKDTVILSINDPKKVALDDEAEDETGDDTEDETQDS